MEEPKREDRDDKLQERDDELEVEDLEPGEKESGEVGGGMRDVVIPPVPIYIPSQ